MHLQTDGSDDEIRHAEKPRAGGVKSEREERTEERTNQIHDRSQEENGNRQERQVRTNPTRVRDQRTRDGALKEG